MKKWEEAVEKFLKEWKSKKEVIGAMVCGSYVIGKPSKHSDIDLHIILSDSIKWRERGNKFVDGFLIEYFANPSNQLKHYFEDDLSDNSYQSPTMFLTGKIIFDKEGKIKELKKLAEEYRKKSFKKFNEVSLELQKYSLWDNLDNLQDNAISDSPDFNFIYFNSLEALRKAYCRYLGYVISNIDKAYKTLNKKEYRNKYLQEDFPDKTFIKLFNKCLHVEDKKKMMKKFEKITIYVFHKMGSFNIDGWKIRSKVEK